jgi:hypothetical protein
MLSAHLLISTAALVLLLPVPAITGTLPFTTSTVNLIVSFLSCSLIVEASPVVPQIIIASVLCVICHSRSSASFPKSTPSSLNGVTIATPEPVNKLITSPFQIFY